MGKTSHFIGEFRGISQIYEATTVLNEWR